jgi:formylglycine-generating enzyme
MTRLAPLVVLVCGCTLWPLDSPFEPRACDPRCPAGQRCYQGRCVTLDGGVNLYCGNGRIDESEAEVCEPGQLGGKTCQDFGLQAGELACSKDCRSFDRSRCRGCDESWCTIPAGTFLMGSPPDEPCREVGSIKETRHQVTLTRAIQMMRGELPRWVYLQAMGKDPSTIASCAAGCPVESVSWHMAAAVCNALSSGASLKPCYSCMLKGNEIDCTVVSAFAGEKIYSCPGFRLPTEAEWEHAYRAGSTTAFFGGANDGSLCLDTRTVDPGADASGWYRLNSGGGPHVAGGRPPNAWGLSDMAGNVAEWCHDYFQNDLGSAAVTDPVGQVTGAPTRVLRGGSWDSLALELRAAARETRSDTDRSNRLGVRCVRTLEP